jgi:hypothetical protein
MASSLGLKPDPYCGLVCGCGHVSKLRTLAESTRYHIRNKHVQQIGVVDAIVADLECAAVGLAVLHVSCTKAAEKAFLLDYLEKINLFRCLECETVGVIPKRSRNFTHSSVTCRGKLEQIEGYRSGGVSPNKQMVITNDQFEEGGDTAYSDIYLPYLLEARRSRHFASRTRADEIVTEDSDSDTGASDLVEELAPSIFPCPLVPFHSSDISPILIGAFGDSLKLDDIQGRKERLFFYEMEAHAIRGVGQVWLVDFARECYERLAVVHFEGSWLNCSSCLASLASPRKTYFEANLWKIMKITYARMNQAVVSANSEFRVGISQIGGHRPKQRIRKLKERIREIMETSGQDEGSDFENQDMSQDEKDALLREIVSIVDDESAPDGIPRQLNPLIETTLNSYRPLGCNYVVFLLRFYRKVAGGQATRHWIDQAEASIFQRPDLFSSPVLVERAIGFCLTLLVGSLHLEEGANYDDMVLKKNTAAEVFCLAQGISQEVSGDRTAFRINSPYTVHSTASKLAYCLRISSLSACVHAALTNDLRLQQLLPNSESISSCRTWQSLANLQRKAKHYEGLLREGIKPAVVSSSSPELELPDTFTVVNARSNRSVLVTRSKLCNLVRRGTEDISNMLETCLRGIRNGERLRAYAVLTKEEVMLDISDDRVWDALLASLHTYANTILNPGTVKVLVDHNSRKRNGDGSLSKETYASTLAAKYEIRISEGEKVCIVESKDLADLISVSLGTDPIFCQTFFQCHRRIPIILGLLMTIVTRGSPRHGELYRFRTGITNKLYSGEMICDLMSHAGVPGRDMVELLIQFIRIKFGSTGSNSSGLLLLPEHITFLLTNYLALIRTGAILYLSGKEAFMEDNTQLHSLATKLFQEVDLVPGGATVTEWKSVTESIEGYMNQQMGLEPGALTGPTLRQVLAAVANVIDIGEGKAKEASINRFRARGFNHGVHTHQRDYSDGVMLGPTRVAYSLLDRLREMDKKAHEYFGCSGLDYRFSPLETCSNWRRLRLFSGEEAHGAVKFAGKLQYNKMELQSHIMNETTSCVRDCLMVFPCGSGKTLVLYAAVMYSFACFLSRLEMSEQCDKIADRIIEKGSRTGSKWRNVDSSQLAVKICNDPDVRRFILFCKRDTRPPPVQLVNIVLVPFKSTREETLSELNEKQLVRSEEYSDSILEGLIQIASEDAKSRHSEPFSVDVLVLTVAKAVESRTREVIEAAMAVGIVGILCLDEAHTGLSNLSWMRHASLIRTFRRKETPLAAMTGTLQKSLQYELAQLLLSRVGMTSPVSHVASLPSNCHHVEVDDAEAMALEWTRRKGMYRSRGSVSPNIGVAFMDLSDRTENEMIMKTLMAAKKALVSTETLIIAKRVLILCRTRSQAEIMFERAQHFPYFQRNGVSLLLGNDDTGSVERFNTEFTRGEGCLGIATSVGVQSLNNPNLTHVFMVEMYYNMQMFVQGMSRASRKGQKAICVFIHRDLVWKMSSSHGAADCDFFEHNVCGINVNDEDVRRGLSTDSMYEFVHCGKRDCYRTSIETEVDGEPSLGKDRNVGWCCTHCDAEMEVYMGDIFGTQVVLQAMPRPSSVPRRQISLGALASPIARHRPTGTLPTVVTPVHNNPYAPQECRFQVLPSEESSFSGSMHRHQLSIDNRVETHEKELLRVFLMHEGILENDSKKCCVWHPCQPLHTNPRLDVFLIPNCRRLFTVYCGRKGGSVCFKCGGLVEHCIGSDGACKLKKLQAPFSSNYCTRCGIYHSVGVRHQIGNCPDSRTWGLAIWALRSISGHRATKSEWNASFRRLGGSKYPRKVPFLQVTPTMIEDWTASNEWLLSNHSTNQFFWTSVFRATQKLIDK